MVKILIVTITRNWVILKAELDMELLIPLTCLTEMFNSFRISSKCVKSYEINCGPRSQMMSSGRPWCLNASCNTRLAVSSLVNAFMHGRKCASLVKRSTTVRMASTPAREESILFAKLPISSPCSGELICGYFLCKNLDIFFLIDPVVLL